MARVTRLLGVAFLIASGGCSAPQAVATRDDPRPAVLRIAADPFIASLAQEFARVAPTVQIRTPALKENAWTAIQRNDVDLAIAPANNAYFAYVEAAQRGVSPDAQLRVISALHVTPFILVVRPDSGIRRVVDLRGHTVARYLSRSSPGAPRPSAPAGTPPQAGTPDTMRVTELVLDAFGVGDVRMVGRLTAAETISAFKQGTVDAAFGTAYFQKDAFDTLTAAGARLIPIEGAEIDDLRRRFPFIRPAIVAAGTYPGQSTPVRTIGVDLLLVCRSGLDAELVYALTRQYFAALPALLAKTDSVGRVDLERASASPIPLHDGAARYYRESEIYR